ncbi:MAG: CoA pyrophosphatase [Proteobacteria bacterium]|nr:CoA pyrophosphatase [Pseudomonadota bacterium]
MQSRPTLDQIREITRTHKPDKLSPPKGTREASVLIAFYPTPEGLSLIFMKRPDTPDFHGGQISFPGGKKDPVDTDIFCTAVRETEEEIGIKRGDIEVWGALNSLETGTSRFWVSPVVGFVPHPYQFAPNPEEVERLLIVPLKHLLAPETFSNGPYHWQGYDIRTPMYTYKDDVIWGLTARILQNLFFLLQNGREY